MKTECGLIGTFINNPISKEDLWYTLSEIQHRGQDSYGFLSIHSSNTNAEGFETKITKEKGLLPEMENLDLYGSNDNNSSGSNGSNDVGRSSVDMSIGNNKTGILFLGHMRYSTNTSVENLDASLTECNIQPVEISKEYGIYIAHNGNLPNLKDNMRRLGLGQYYKNGMSDTYLFKVIWNVKFAGKFKVGGNTCSLQDIQEYLKYILLNVVGAYSCVMTFCEPQYSLVNSSRESVSSITSDASDSSTSVEDTTSSINNKFKFYLLGFRDRYGYKPLSIGSLVSNSECTKEGVANYCFFSESVQLQHFKYFIRDVCPGEIWYSENNNKPSLLGRINEKIKDNNKFGFLCSLEAIYFMKRETLLFHGNTTVNNFRQKLGVELAKRDIYNLSQIMNPVKPYENYYDAQQILKKELFYICQKVHIALQ